MDNDARYQYLRELLHEWPTWGTLERAASVVRLRNAGYSLRKLAKVAGCSEGTIRNYEILGRIPPAGQQFLYDGRVSMRRLVKAARKAANKPELT